MAVTRCVCFQQTFRAIQAQAKASGWTTTAQISLNMRCGLGCGGCRPYLQAMLETGASCFAVRTDDRPPQPCKPEPWDIQ
jgi:bacterioferritin-associated ferredoxin